uniref:DENN domain-containing protein 2A-like n=3 Tax=Paramormyrops kingsleyae TaxID=1676925 RepID=A0A3B3RZ97_9TELE|nr:DENN domain-containing protein 2A-like isoform X2 [Paramormyrops kingsleyae]
MNLSSLPFFNIMEDCNVLRMPVANNMTGGQALQLCTNTVGCAYQSFDGLQCRGFKVQEVASVPPQRPGYSWDSHAKSPLSSLDNFRDSLEYPRMPACKRAPKTNELVGGDLAPQSYAGVKIRDSIREKISQWESKKEAAFTSPAMTMKGPEAAGEVDCKTSEEPKGQGKRVAIWEQQDSGKENAGRLGDSRPRSHEAAGGSREQMSGKRNHGKAVDALQEKSVLTHIKKLEQDLREGPGDPHPNRAESYFCPPHKEELEQAGREEQKPIIGSLNGTRSKSSLWGHKENQEGKAKELAINPVPKPQRTFQYPVPKGGCRPALCKEKAQRNLPPLPSAAPPSPRVNLRPHQGGTGKASHRKSKEFEDVLWCSPRDGRVEWYAQAKLSLTHTQSEENIYEDILDLPSKEHQYEDIQLDAGCLGNGSFRSLSPPSPAPYNPSPVSSRRGLVRQNTDGWSHRLQDLHGPSPTSTPSSPDDTPRLSGNPYNRRQRKISKLVIKINSIFEARRGKNRMKRISPSTESSSGRDENSESETDTDNKQKADSQRLMSVQAVLRQMGRGRLLDRDALDLNERKLFEYFLVVALQKAKSRTTYVPVVIQQFPLKLERSFKFMRETEDQVKVIPQFCFPDTKDWIPVESFPSETFSFVLTGEDGSRRFGYCRRLLPSGRGRRLPEVYCMVSQLGCFDLFSKILDEVEKRRALSPALVLPLMRGILEAPFPAPGRTIPVKSFLPGSGTEVMELHRPADSRLEHVDFECLFSCLSVRLLLQVFASLLLERRVIFTATRLSTLSQCCHAAVALLYPFTWQHTHIPVLPPAMMDIVCTPTPYIVGLLSRSLPQLKELPLEEVLLVNLDSGRFLQQLGDEDCILPHKLQAALEHILGRRTELACESSELPSDSSSLSIVVSETFVRFFVEMVGHYPLFMGNTEREEDSSSSSSSPTPYCLQRKAFRKAIYSRSLRRFLDVFMETQMFSGFIQEREQRKHGLKGLFETRVQEYLDSLPWIEHCGVNKFLKGLGHKMKLLSRK